MPPAPQAGGARASPRGKDGVDPHDGSCGAQTIDGILSGHPISSLESVSSTPTAAGGEKRLKVFLSYSRDDLDIAQQLHATLVIGGYVPFMDAGDIEAGEGWEQRLRDLVRSADTVLVLLSPSSIRSKACQDEIVWAIEDRKRIIPLACRPLGSERPHAHVEAINYIYLYAEPRKHGTGFGPGLLELRSALDTDLDWLREHTRLFERASEWQADGRKSFRLLSGTDITAAKTWLERQPSKAPKPTDLVQDFIRISEEEDQRQQQAELQRERDLSEALRDRVAALEESTQAKQRVVSRTLIGLGASLVLAGVAGGLAWVASQQRDKAERALQQIRASASIRVASLVEEVRNERWEGSQASVPQPTAQVTPSWLDAVATRAQAHLDRGDGEAARKVADEGLTAAPAELSLGERTDWALAVLRLHRVRAQASERLGDVASAAAETSFRTALEVAERLARSHPAAADARDALARALLDFGMFWASRADWQQAEHLMQRLLAQRIAEHAATPAQPTARLRLAIAHDRLAQLLLDRENASERPEPTAETMPALADVQRHLTAAVALIEAPANGQAHSFDQAQELAYAYQLHADLQGLRKRPSEAIVWIDRTIALTQQIAQRPEADETVPQNLAAAHYRRALLLASTARTQEAIASLDQSIGAHERALELGGRSRPEWMRDIATALQMRAKWLVGIGRPEDAVESLRSCLAWRERAAAVATDAGWQAELKDAYRDLRVSLIENKRMREALETAEQQAFSTTLSYFAATPTAAEDKEFRRAEVAEALGQVSWTAILAREPARALQAAKQAREIDPKNDAVRLNLAHALMFSGRTEESRKGYLEGLQGASDQVQPWKKAVLDDFTQLRQFGLGHELMTEVERRMVP